MRELCPKCGLIKEICACDILEKEDVQTIKVYATKKKFRKLVTVVEGLDASKLDVTVKELKEKLACGGTVKEGVIVLQGNHKKKIKDALVAIGYPESSISVSQNIV